MTISLKSTTAIALTLLALGSPAMAATSAAMAAKVTTAQQLDAVPIGQMVDLLGQGADIAPSAWSQADAVTVFDGKTLYNAEDQKRIESAEASQVLAIDRLQKSIRDDKQLADWFSTNHIAVDRVVALQQQDGKLDVYLF